MAMAIRRVCSGWVLMVLVVVPLVSVAGGCDERDASGGDPHARSAPSDHPIDGAEAHRLVAEEEAVVVDVRTPAEYADGHVDVAINVPVDQIAARASELSKERPVIVYCHSGRRSAVAASELRAAGYTVHDLGAMSSWDE